MADSTASDTNYRERSFWLDSSSYRPEPALSGDLTVDVAIVGGGFTGLATAYFLKRTRPDLKVALLESDVIGFGASGRNAGFSMTLFGFSLSLTALRFGRQKAREAHLYMERAVDLVRELVEEHEIDCDYEHAGFLRVATSARLARRIEHELELARSLGLQGLTWLDHAELQRRVRSPLYLGAWWEPRCGLLNPAKLAWGMKRVIAAQGTQIYERTPVTRIQRKQQIVLETTCGTVVADKVVLATNAYSHLLPGMRRKQIPVFTHIVLTEPLSPEILAEIGWEGREGIEDARNLVHYYRLTADNRLLMGGSSVTFAYGRRMERDHNPRTFAALEDNIRRTFPALQDVALTHRWGGPVSVPVDLTPAIGALGDGRVIYSIGCVGHGVSLTHLNGWTIADLLLGQETERTRVFFVNRRTIPWPPEPFRFVLSQAIKGVLELQDVFTDPRPRGGRAALERGAPRALLDEGDR